MRTLERSIIGIEGRATAPQLRPYLLRTANSLPLPDTGFPECLPQMIAVPTVMLMLQPSVYAVFGASSKNFSPKSRTVSTSAISNHSFGLLEKLTVSFSSFGILSHSIMGDARRVVIKRLHFISPLYISSHFFIKKPMCPPRTGTSDERRADRLSFRRARSIPVGIFPEFLR